MPGFKPRADRRYLAFHKPYGVLCQFTSEPGSDKVTLSAFGFPSQVYSVGRLDYDSEGLLILTDDVRLNAALLNPSAGHERTYLAQVEGLVGEPAMQALQRGVIIEGRRARAVRAKGLEGEPADLPERSKPIRFRKSVPTSFMVITLSEGRNRQVRRMTAQVGHPTLRLVRVAIGALRLDALNLAPGQWRDLNPLELDLAFKNAAY